MEKNELKQVKEELKIKDQNIEKLKQKNTKYYKELEVQTKLNEDLNRELKKLNEIINMKDGIISEKVSEINLMEDLKKNYSSIVNNNRKLKGQIDTLNKEKEVYKSEVEKLKSQDETLIKLHKSEEREKELLKQISGLKNKYDSLYNKYEEYYKEFDKFFNARKYQWEIEELINQLTKMFTVSSSLNFRKIISFGKRVERSIEVRNQQAEVEENNLLNLDGIIEYGYLINVNEKIVFITTEGNKYEVLNVPLAFRYDAPAKALVYKNNTATIKYVYNEQESDFEQEIEKSKTIKENNRILENNQNEKFQTIGNYNILIITGIKGKYYKDDLSSLGLNVTIYNPFTQNEDELLSKMDHQDVIIVIQNAVSHKVTNLLDKSDNRVQFITRDNIKYIIARIRYTLIQNGLLEEIQ